MNPMVDPCICLEAIFFRCNSETPAVLGSSCSAKEIKIKVQKAEVACIYEMKCQIEEISI